MQAHFDFLSNGGELGALMRAKDWEATPLGRCADWPALLKTTVRLILSSRHPMFLWWGPELIQFYNDAYRQTMGPERHPSALGDRGRTCWDEIWPIIGPQIDYVMAGRGATWHEDQLVPVTRHGAREDVWWTYGYSPIEDETGVRGVLVVCNDVTAEHKAKHELEVMNHALTEQIRQREQAQHQEAIQTAQRILAEREVHLLRNAETERICSLLEQAPGFICILNGREHVFEFANTAYLRLVGGRELLGRPIRAALPELAGQGYFELLDQVYQSGEAVTAVNVSYVLNSGAGLEPVHGLVDFVYQPIVTDGRVSGVFVEGFDTTARAAMKQAFERSEQRLREGMIAARMVVWDWDLLTNAISFSENAPELFGASWTDVPTLHRYMDPDDLRRLDGQRRVALETCGNYEDVVRMTRPDNGEAIWMQVRGTVIAGADGRPVCIRGVSVDVSARKRAEESLREAARHKDEFLAMLSHELRNPLAPIRTAAHLLGISPDNAERVKQSSRIIERQVTHMTSLINDLLDVSRVNTGLVVLEKEVIDIALVAQESIEQAQPLMAERGHSLTVRVPDEGQVRVMGDRKRLVQVLTNLLHNAAKYTPGGGSIALDISQHGGMVEIHVRDNGIGVDAELLPHIFELFTQEKRSSDRSQGGLGLGLALVRSLVQLHGGHVTAASGGRDQGATFSVYLPRFSGACACAGQLPAAHGQSDNALRLMVVDDNEDAANAIAMMLEMEGHVVQVEHDPVRALERAAAFAPDACLLDIGLPGMDGHELARRLRCDDGACGATLIALTGYGNKYDQQSTVLAGFDHYFVKPANTTELIAVLSQLKPLGERARA